MDTITTTTPSIRDVALTACRSAVASARAAARLEEAQLQAQDTLSDATWERAVTRRHVDAARLARTEGRVVDAIELDRMAAWSAMQAERLWASPELVELAASHVDVLATEITQEQAYADLDFVSARS